MLFTWFQIYHLLVFFLLPESQWWTYYFSIFIIIFMVSIRGLIKKCLSWFFFGVGGEDQPLSFLECCACVTCDLEPSCTCVIIFLTIHPHNHWCAAVIDPWMLCAHRVLRHLTDVTTERENQLQAACDMLGCTSAERNHNWRWDLDLRLNPETIFSLENNKFSMAIEGKAIGNQCQDNIDSLLPDHHGIVPKEQNVNIEYYLTVIHCLQDVVRCKTPRQLGIQSQ